MSSVVDIQGFKDAKVFAMSQFSHVDIDVSNNDQRCSTDRDVSCSLAYSEHKSDSWPYVTYIRLQLVVDLLCPRHRW